MALFIILTFYFIFFHKTTFDRKIFISVSIVLLCLIALINVGGILEKLSYYRPIGTLLVLHEEPFDILLSGRVRIWKGNLEMIYDYPVLGIGPGMWKELVSEYLPKLIPRLDSFGDVVWYYPSSSHSTYTYSYLNWGLLPFICFISLIYIFFRKTIKNIKGSSSNFMKNISIATLLSLISWAVIGITNDAFATNTMFKLLFWSNIAMIIKLNNFISVEKPKIAD